MVKNSRFFVFVCLSGLMLLSCNDNGKDNDFSNQLTQVTETTSVAEILSLLGDPLPTHFTRSEDEATIEAGRKLIHQGKAPHPATGEIGPRISEYFYCSDCHNTDRETGSLSRLSNPLATVDYLSETDMPLPPGTTFSGLVNRESWYNGDYAHKYSFSPIVRSARTSLRSAIELCSRECSQGRTPEPWEMEAMIAYLWTLQWKLSDFGYTGLEVAELKRRAIDPSERPILVDELKSHYEIAAPASFGTPPEDPNVGYATARDPDPEMGAEIWNRACQHCHGAEGASEHYFGNKKTTWAKLNDRFSDSDESIYHLIREGTQPGDEKSAYMPNYTRERLSDIQIEDLRAFIESRAKESGS